jgi:acetyltransferase-like isoleucine patch superfamily enzyme
MNLHHFIQQSFFVLKTRCIHKIFFFFRVSYYRLQGMIIGKGTGLPKLFATWPHQILLGKNCRLEHGIYFHYDGVYSKGPSIIIGNEVFIGNHTEFNISEKISIGSNCLIAAGCRFVDHNHGTEKNTLIKKQLAPKKEIILEDDVWLGCNVVVLKGVCIGEGAVVAAGSIVTKSIPAYEIWGGMPAKFIRKRV